MNPLSRRSLLSVAGAALGPVLGDVWAGKRTAQASIPALIPQLNEVLAQTQG